MTKHKLMPRIHRMSMTQSDSRLRERLEGETDRLVWRPMNAATQGVSRIHQERKTCDARRHGDPT